MKGKKSFKRNMALIVVVTLVLSTMLSACGSKEESVTPPAGGDTPATEPVAGGGGLADYDRAGTASKEDETSKGAPESPEPVIVPVPAGAEGKTWKLKADEQGMDEMPMLKNERDAFEHIKVRTNGQVDITMYPNATLLPFESKFSGVAQGQADLTIYMADINEGTQPISGLMNTAHQFEASNAQDMTKIYRKFIRNNEIFDKENAAKGVVWVSNWALAPTELHLTKGDVRVPSDMKGHKTLVTTTQVSYMESMGGAALVTGIGDYYSSLEKGVADSILAHWPIMEEFKMIDLMKTHTIFSDTNDYAGIDNMMQGWLANKAVWDTIPPEYQQVIREELDWAADATAYDNDNRIAKAIAYAESIGNTINRLTPEEAQQWYDKAVVQRDDWIAYATKNADINEADALALYEAFNEAVKNKDM